MEVLFEKLERKIEFLLAQKEDLMVQNRKLHEEMNNLKRINRELVSKLQVVEDRLFKVVDSFPEEDVDRDGIVQENQ